MRAVIQRVSSASVVVNGGAPRAIGPGLVILLGVKDGEDGAIVPKLAAKCANLRIFDDDAGKRLTAGTKRLSFQTLRSTAIHPAATGRALSARPKAKPPKPSMKIFCRRSGGRASPACSMGSLAPICS